MDATLVAKANTNSEQPFVDANIIYVLGMTL